MPMAVKFFFISAVVATLTSAACSFSWTGRGVLAGATMENQFTAMSPGIPCSAAVGISGMSGMRFSAAIASPRILPCWTCV